MSAKTRFLRFVMGVLLVIIILAVSFSVLPTWIHTWGATQEELERTYPGDEILPQPQIQWTHGLTVAAPAQTVWQWIIQIGDTRAGYYSYTFIENLISGEDLYHNADRIMPEYQNPQPGDGIIADIMVIREYEPNRWMLAEAKMGIGWTWLWYVDPIDDSQSRLVVRMNTPTRLPISL